MHNRFDMLTAFTGDEMSVLYELVMFHDECPDHIDEDVFEMVQEKVADAFAEVKWLCLTPTLSLATLLLFLVWLV